jgi:hypothetical protein
MSVRDDRVELLFLQAPGEPPIEDANVQADLRAATAGLSSHLLSRRMRFKDATATPALVLAEVVVPLGVAVLGAVGHAVATWIKVKGERTVSVKIGEVSVTTHTEEETLRVLTRALEIRARPQEGGGAAPQDWPEKLMSAILLVLGAIPALMAFKLERVPKVGRLLLLLAAGLNWALFFSINGKAIMSWVRVCLGTGFCN